MKDKQMEELIDACYDAMFQRDEEVEKWLDEQYDRLDKLEYEKQEIGLIMHGQSNYYYQYPDEYEKDRRIVKLENEVERLKVYEKAFQLLKYKHNYFTFVNENIGTIDVDLAISMAREMLKDD